MSATSDRWAYRKFPTAQKKSDDAASLIQGRQYPELTESVESSGNYSPEAPLENLASLSLRFSGGAIGTMVCGNRMPDAMNDVTVYGSDGRVFLKNSAGPALGGSLEVTSETVNTTVSYEPDPLALTKWQIEGFNRAVFQDEEPRASGMDGLRSVQVTEAMIESAKTRRTVSVEPVNV